MKGDPIAGSLTFQHIIQIIGWVCFGVTTLLFLGLCIPHFRRYRAPNEQRQVFRIILLPVVYSITSVVSIHAYKAAQYIEPIANLYEALALASLFLLYVHYVAPEVHSRDEFFHRLEQKKKNGEIVGGGSLRWFRVSHHPSTTSEVNQNADFEFLQRAWRTIFVYVVVYTILIIAQEITQATGVYCQTSNKARFAHVWVCHHINSTSVSY
jgi:hypothetical protein